MDMTLLRRLAGDLTLWDDEKSRGAYIIPLREEVAATGQSLLEGIPKKEVYRLGPFWCARSPESHIGCFRHVNAQAGQPVAGCAHGITYVDWNTHRMTPTGSG